MRAVARAEEFTVRAEQTRTLARQSTVVVRRVRPWSILKFSLLFYFCLMLIFFFALVILYWVLGVIGVLDSLAHLIGELLANNSFRFKGPWIFTRVFIVGGVGVVVWSLVNMCVAMLYNLISDVVGGVEITLSDRR
jgi:hypothetical protein